MKRLLLILCLTFFSTPSFGQWTKITESTQAYSYVNVENIREKDGYVYYWELTDVKPNIEMIFKSSMIYVKVDCAEFKYANLQASYFDDQMGKGKLLHTSRDSVWKYPLPNSVTASVLKRVCK